MLQLEIAITTLEDALHAQAGGADSIEISHDLSVGGLTPAFDVVRHIRDSVSIQVHAIIRPHSRDFVYTPAEIDTILADTIALAQTGIDGIVFGAHRPDCRLDTGLIQQVVSAAAGLPVTLHRALDECLEPEAALEALRGIIPRVLTSGPAATAWNGREGLKRWVERYGKDFHFIAAGSLKIEFIAEYAAFVRADGYHFGSAARSNGAVDSEKVRQIRALLNAPLAAKDSSLPAPE
jgi:copper homeostasis protein